jgi:hypothetical protein
MISLEGGLGIVLVSVETIENKVKIKAHDE